MANSATLMETAQHHQRKGEFPRAEQFYRQVLRADPYNAEAAFLLATACQAQNKPKEALLQLDQALRIRPEYAEAHHARALVFGAKGDFSEAIAELRQALTLKPDYAEAHHNLGVTLARFKKLDEAIAAFRQAIRWNSDYPEAFLNLARACEEKGALEDATAAYQNLLRLRPDDAAIQNSLGLLFSKQRRLPEAASEFQKALALDPGQAVFQNNLGAVLADLGRPADALPYFDEAVRLNPEHADAHKNRGMSLLHIGEFERGWQEFEWRWKCKGFPVRSYRQPAWDGSSLEGRRILLYTEQGIGDTLQFIRYATLLAEQGALVMLECSAALMPILRTCPGVALVIAHGAPLPEFDCHAPLMSLPRLLNTTLTNMPAHVPYLSAEQEWVDRWQRELSSSSAFKVGIVWQGNSKNPMDYRRSVPLECFAPLAEIPGVALYSLQKGRGVVQLGEITGSIPIIDLGGRLDMNGRSFTGTAAAMCNLDLIISSDTASAHLAGALARPVWIPLSFAADWRWLKKRDDSPWYPTMRLFRQERLGEWQPVFQRMAAELASVVKREITRVSSH